MKATHPSFGNSRTVRSIFSLRGVVDADALPPLHRDLGRFAATTEGDIVIDCHDLVSIDAGGVGELLAFHNELLSLARRVSVRRVPAECRAVFEANHLSGLFGEVSPRPIRRPQSALSAVPE
jgi:anti-anti-sigma regulatory factor